MNQPKHIICLYIFVLRYHTYDILYYISYRNNASCMNYNGVEYYLNVYTRHHSWIHKIYFLNFYINPTHITPLFQNFLTFNGIRIFNISIGTFSKHRTFFRILIVINIIYFFNIKLNNTPEQKYKTIRLIVTTAINYYNLLVFTGFDIM